MEFSLIVGTINRTTELEELFTSLCSQGTWDFEVIIVDQNLDDRVAKLTDKWAELFSVRSGGQFSRQQLQHLRSKPGLSKARNAALPLCQGDIIAFPDDDCWYPSNTLMNVSAWFNAQPQYEILSLLSRAADGQISANSWPMKACDLNHLNIFRTSISYAFFVKRTSGGVSLCFDPALGVGSGTIFGSGEDTDFVLSLLRQGMRGRYLAQWYIGHPRRDMVGGNASQQRSMGYGMGMGRVLKKRSLAHLFLAFVLLDFGRSAGAFLLGKSLPARLWFSHGCGIIRAYFATPVPEPIPE